MVAQHKISPCMHAHYMLLQQCKVRFPQGMCIEAYHQPPTHAIHVTWCAIGIHSFGLMPCAL